MLATIRPVGIEIGPQSVKVAQLAERRGAVRMARFAEESFPAGYRWEVGGDRGPLVETVRRALSRAGIHSRRAILSLPRGQVTARISALPPADRQNLRQVVEYDLADHIPFSIEQVIVDFQRLGPSREQPGLTDYLVVAVPRELVREHLRLAEELGLRVSAITVDALAMDDLSRRAGREPTGLSVAMEIGPRVTTINVTQGDHLRLTRSVGVGASQLARAIQDDLQVSAGEAQQIRDTEGLAALSRTGPGSATQVWLDNLLGEVRRSVLSFGSSRVTHLLLVGAESAIPGLAERLQEEFGAEPAVLTAATAFPGAEMWGDDPRMADRCLLAMAVCLRGSGKSAWSVSLLPAEMSEARRRGVLRAAAALGLAAALAVMAAGYLLSTRRAGRERVATAALRAQAEDAAERQHAAEAVLSTRDELAAQVDALDIAQVRRYFALELMRAIAEHTYAPQEISLTHFIARPEQPLELRGRAPNSLVVADLQQMLGQFPLVREARLTSAERPVASRAGPARGGREQSPSAPGDRLVFTIQASLWTQREAGPRRVALRQRGGTP